MYVYKISSLESILINSKEQLCHIQRYLKMEGGGERERLKISELNKTSELAVCVL